MSSLVLIIFFLIWIPVTVVAGLQASAIEWVEAFQVALFIAGIMASPYLVIWLLRFISGPHNKS